MMILSEFATHFVGNMQRIHFSSSSFSEEKKNAEES